MHTLQRHKTYHKPSNYQTIAYFSLVVCEPIRENMMYVTGWMGRSVGRQVQNKTLKTTDPALADCTLFASHYDGY